MTFISQIFIEKIHGENDGYKTKTPVMNKSLYQKDKNGHFDEKLAVR